MHKAFRFGGAFFAVFALLVLASAGVMAQSSRFVDDWPDRVRPGSGSGVDRAGTTSATVVLKCSIDATPAPAGTATQSGNCSCTSTGVGAASCACRVTNQPPSANSIVPTLVLSGFFASAEVPEDLLEAIAIADSCPDAATLVEAAAGARSGASCQFSNLMYSCRL
jgi:hypothetical protein